MTANHRPLEEGDIELIDRIRATPCLYDTKDIHFRYVAKKEEEWQSITEGLDMTHWEARKRWTVLRDRYARELKQLVLHPDSTEYGKSDFFIRMDFLRNFIKKREAKRKRNIIHLEETESQEKPKPVKLYRVNSDHSSLESACKEGSQHSKSYIFEDSENLSSSNYSFVEQDSQESMQQSHEHDETDYIDEKESELEFHEYVEDTSGNYETIEHEILEQENAESYTLTPMVNKESITINSSCPKLVKTFSTATVEDDESKHAQKHDLTNVCTKGVTSHSPEHVEEYFSKTIALYLRQLQPRYKIKAKVEMMQIIEKYIDLQESKS